MNFDSYVRRVLRSLLAASLVASGISVYAQLASSRPVTIVVPFPAGGTPDLAARLLSQGMSIALNQPVLVDPKPGANGAIGTAYVAQAASDGYTLLLATLSHVTNPLLQADVRWNPVADFSGVAMLATAPVVAVVPSSPKVESRRAFVALARSKPGNLNYLMPGLGTSMHLNTELLKRAANMDIVAIPYKGTPQGLPQLLQGDLAFAMLPLSTALPYIKSGKLKALAVVAAKRLDLIPNVPTLAEEGYSQAQVLSWYALLAPARTPGPVLDQLNHAAAQALRDPTIQQRREDLGIYPEAAGSPAEVDRMLKAESRRWEASFVEMKLEKQ